MTTNDAQMDVLLRRYGKQVNSEAPSGHLDADEMNAFAEGSLPQAARARYVSHLADCDPCRKLVANLALSSGVVSRAEDAVPESAQARTFWQTLSGLFALPVLRYAAFAAVLLVVAGVAFLALRRSQEPVLVAVNEPTNEHPQSAVKPPESSAQPTVGSESKQGNVVKAPSAPQPTTGSDQPLKRDESNVAESTTQPQQTLKDAPAPGDLAAKKAGESEVARKPSYAPPPPGETQTMSSRGQLSAGGIMSAGGPRKEQQSVDKITLAQQEREVAKDTRRVDDNSRGTSNQPATPARKSADEKAKGPRRDSDNVAVNRSANESRAEPPKTSGAQTENRISTEEAPQTRSVGGRKFRRQGSAWVDQKFKSSMTLKNISRGSDEFAALDSGLRSIAQQLGGEIIVVWKSKAYLIR